MAIQHVAHTQSRGTMASADARGCVLLSSPVTWRRGLYSQFLNAQPSAARVKRPRGVGTDLAQLLSTGARDCTPGVGSKPCIAIVHRAHAIASQRIGAAPPLCTRQCAVHSRCKALSFSRRVCGRSCVLLQARSLAADTHAGQPGIELNWCGAACCTRGVPGMPNLPRWCREPQGACAPAAAVGRSQELGRNRQGREAAQQLGAAVGEGTMQWRSAAASPNLMVCSLTPRNH